MRTRELLVATVVILRAVSVWADAPQKSVEVCSETERNLYLSGASAEQMIDSKGKCLEIAHSFDEFHLIAQPACDFKKCPARYSDLLESFVLKFSGDYIFPGSRIEDVRQLTCLMGTVDTKTRMIEIGMQAITSQKDWEDLTTPVRCDGLGQMSWDYATRVYRLRDQDQAYANQLIAQKAPDSPAGAASQMIAALQELKMDWSPVFSPTMSALLDSAQDYQRALPAGEQRPEVRARSHLIVLFESYAKDFCAVWDSSRLVRPICQRVLAPIAYLKNKFPPDLAVNRAMEMRVAIATLDGLKRRIGVQDWGTYVEPIDTQLRELVAYAVAGGDASSDTRDGIAKLADVMNRRVSSGDLSPAQYLLREMSSTGDDEIKIDATETYKRIMSICDTIKR